MRYFSHLRAVAGLKVKSVSIYHLPSNNAVRCRQLLCHNCLADLYTQFYGPQPGRSWWSVTCLGYIVSSMEPNSSRPLIIHVGHWTLSWESCTTHTHARTIRTWNYPPIHDFVSLQIFQMKVCSFLNFTRKWMTSENHLIFINPAVVPWGLCDPSPLWLTFF
jgi:hypothetical protein